MKKTYFYIIATMAMILTGCSNDDWVKKENGANGTFTITASIENFGSRTAMNGNQVLWEKDDKIALFDSEGDRYEATLNDESVGKATGDFSTNVDISGKEIVVALYPYNESATYSNDVINTSIANSYYWKEGANSKAPMAAKVTDVSNISFKNAGSLIALTVNNIPAGYNHITLSSNICLAGSAKISFSDNVPNSSINDNSDENKQVTINFESSIIETDKTFYFPISVADYVNNKLDIIMSDDGTNTQTLLDNKAIENAARNKRYYKTINFDTNGNMPTPLQTGDDINIKISEGNTSFILDESTAVAEITASVSEPLDIAVTSENESFTLNGEYVGGQVNLSTPVETKKLTFDLPNATVEVRPDAGVATFTQITASTAENTLVIPAGVTVEDLIIKKGNVKLYGTIKSIKNESGKQIILYYGDGSSYPSDLNNVETVDIENARSLDDIKSVFADGGEFTLQQDIQLENEPLTLDGKNVTINLNGHTINGGLFSASGQGEVSSGTSDSYVFLVKAGKLTINGYGNVVAKEAEYSMAVWAIGESSEVEINGGSYYNDGDGCDLIYAKNGAKITINGGEFKATENKGEEPGTNNKYSALNLSDNTGSSIIVKGGKFYRFNPAKNESENPEKDFVASGYSSVKEGDWYVVKEGICDEVGLKAAFANATEGQTIKLGDDIELMESLTIAAGKTVTLDLNGKAITMVDNVEATGNRTMLTNKGTLTIADNSENKTGVLDYKYTAGDDVSYALNTITNHGVLILKSGKVLNSSTPTNSNNFAIDSNSTSSETSVIVEGGTVECSTFCSIRMFANSTTKNNELYIKNGGIKGQVWLQSPNNNHNMASLTIEGGSFEPMGRDGSSVYITKASSNAVILAVSGGTFNTKIGSDAATGFITGGTFTTVAKENTQINLLAEGYVFEENSDGTWIVAKDNKGSSDVVEQETLPEEDINF